VKALSSIFDVSQQLLLILSLAVSGEPASPTPVREAPAPVSYMVEGPLHFSEQIWLEALKEGHGGEELESTAGRIFRTSSGRYYVPAEADRGYVLSLRQDADIAKYVAFRLAQANAKVLETKLGRPAAVPDIYLAHKVGTQNALRLLSLAQKSPDAETGFIFPEIGEVAPEMLFHQGRPSRLKEFIAKLKRVTRFPSRMTPATEGAALRVKGALRPRLEGAETGDARAGELAQLGWDAVVTRAR
jgi:hypothetical protein